MGLKSHIVRTKRTTKLVYISVPTLMLLSGLILNPVTVSHEEASAATGTATAATTSLTLTSSNNSANVAITPKSVNGSFAMSSTAGEAQFGVTTNNFTGYELSIVADDDSGNLANTDGNVGHSIFSIDAPMTKDSFDTTTYNNRWGYKPNKYVANNTVIDNTGDSAVFLPSPTTTGTILDHTTVANSSANNYSIALGVRADYNTYAGSYAKAFKLQVTANPASYTINFNKNTADAVANMPTTQSSASVSATSIALVNNIPERAHYSFLGWCSTTTTTSNGIDSCSGTVYNPNGAGTNLTYGLDQTTANTTTLYAMWKIDTFTCTKQYRRENADGSWEAYQQEPVTSNDIVNYGGSCSYTKTITNYRGASNAANGAQGSASASNITANTTLSLDFYRNTYTLTVSAGTNTSNPSGSGTYRWGQTDIPVYIDKNANVTCTSYAVPTWTQSGTAGTVGTTTQYSGNRYKMNFAMGNGNVVLTAASAASNVSQTITLSRSGGASGINIGGTNYTSSSASLTCGTYNISGNYDSGYEFNSWSASGSASVASTSSASTTMAVSGSGTLTLTGKQSCTTNTLPSGTGIMQTYSISASTLASVCPGATTTLRDNRDNTTYTIGKLADGKIWLLDNLALDLTNSTVKANLSATTTNASNTTLNYLKNGGGTTSDKYATAGVANATSVDSYSAPLVATSGTCSRSDYCANDPSSGRWTKNSLISYGNGSGKIGVYYNYCAASAGSYCYGNGTSEGSPSGNATEDICPAGWRMPTGGANGEYQALYTAYSSNATNFKNALRTSLSGIFATGWALDQGSLGLFWSSTYGINWGMYSLVVFSSNVNPQSGGGRNEGLSVRCILK